MSMSTPIQALPQSAQPPPSAKLDDDPVVTDVIEEMQLEFNKPSPSSNPAMPPPPSMAPQMMAHTPPYMAMPGATPPSKAATWFDSEAAKRAAIVAVIAFVLLYPCDMSDLYAKVPFGNKISSYDRLIRVGLLAVVLYVVFWKLEI
jgi:hypothetical protein